MVDPSDKAVPFVCELRKRLLATSVITTVLNTLLSTDGSQLSEVIMVQHDEQKGSWHRINPHSDPTATIIENLFTSKPPEKQHRHKPLTHLQNDEAHKE